MFLAKVLCARSVYRPEQSIVVDFFISCFGLHTIIRRPSNLGFPPCSVRHIFRNTKQHSEKSQASVTDASCSYTSSGVEKKKLGKSYDSH